MVAFQLILNGVSLGAVYAMVAVGFALVACRIRQISRPMGSRVP